MKLTQTTPPIHFSSRIRFVTGEEYHHLPFAPETPRINLNGQHNIDIFEQPTRTGGIIMCNAGGVTASKPFALFHFIDRDPEHDKGQVKALHEHIKRLKRSNPDLRALLVGSQSVFPPSTELNDEIKKLFQKEGIPFSSFQGHIKDWQSNIAYEPMTDTWYVNTFNWPPSPSMPPEVTNLPTLKAAFEEIKVDPEDVVEIGSRRYAGDEVRKTRNESA